MYSFLIVDLCLLLLPFLFAIDRSVFKTMIVRSAVLPSIIATVVFSEVAVFFAQSKVWNFNPAHILENSYRNLPLEGYLFIFALCFSGLAIYNYLNAKFPNNELQKYSLAISNLLLGVFVAVLFFAYKQWFPLVTVAMLLIMLLAIEYVNKLRFMYRFYRAFLVSLLPLYISFGILGNLPIIHYKSSETIGVTLANIPFEIHFYMMGLMLLGVYFLEYFKNRKAQ